MGAIPQCIYLSDMKERLAYLKNEHSKLLSSPCLSPIERLQNVKKAHFLAHKIIYGNSPKNQQANIAKYMKRITENLEDPYIRHVYKRSLPKGLNYVFSEDDIQIKRNELRIKRLLKSNQDG